MVTVSEIITNQSMGLIHCQSALNEGSIIAEICYVNKEIVKAVDINNF